MKFLQAVSVLIVLALALPVCAEPTVLPHVFTPGSSAVASEVNANFQALVTAIDADVVVKSTSSLPPSATPGQLNLDTTTNTLNMYDGTQWRSFSYEHSIPLRMRTNTVVGAGAVATLNFGGVYSLPSSVTVWNIGPANPVLLTGNPNFPVTYTGSGVSVTNNSGSAISIAIVVLVHANISMGQ